MLEIILREAIFVPNTLDLTILSCIGYRDRIWRWSLTRSIIDPPPSYRMRKNVVPGEVFSCLLFLSICVSSHAGNAYDSLS